MVPLRWLLLAGHVPSSGSLGGIVRYVVELARGLSQHPDVELHVLSRRDAIPLWEELGLESRTIHALPEVPSRAYPLVESLGVGLPRARGGWDVVHGAKHMVPVGAIGGAGRVLTVHDMLPLDRPQDFRLSKRVLLPRPYLESIRRSKVLLCVSHATRARLLHYCPDVSDRAVVVPLATSESLQQVEPVEIPELVGRRFALVVAVPSPRKNLATVVNAWRGVIDKNPDAVLAVAGLPAGHRAHSLELGHDLVESGAILQLGHVSDGELAWAYQNSSVVLCPSLLEGFGLPAAEALVFRTPLVTSRDPALTEVSGPGVPHVDAGDVIGWTGIINEILEGNVGLNVDGVAVAAASRTWKDVADETVAIVQGRLNWPQSAWRD